MPRQECGAKYFGTSRCPCVLERAGEVLRRLGLLVGHEHLDDVVGHELARQEPRIVAVVEEPRRYAFAEHQQESTGELGNFPSSPVPQFPLALARYSRCPRVRKSSRARMVKQLGKLTSELGKLLLELVTFLLFYLYLEKQEEPSDADFHQRRTCLCR